MSIKYVNINSQKDKVSISLTKEGISFIKSNKFDGKTAYVFMLNLFDYNIKHNEICFYQDIFSTDFTEFTSENGITHTDFNSYADISYIYALLFGVDTENEANFKTTIDFISIFNYNESVKEITIKDLLDFCELIKRIKTDIGEKLFVKKFAKDHVIDEESAYCIMNMIKSMDMTKFIRTKSFELPY